MKECPKCKRNHKKEITFSDFIPNLKWIKCFNCRKKYTWIFFLNKKIILKEKSLLD